jgi:hypothetical protein
MSTNKDPPSIRTISINPDLLRISPTSTTRKNKPSGSKEMKFKNPLKPKRETSAQTLRRKMIKFIRDNQDARIKQKSGEQVPAFSESIKNTNPNDTFQSEFQESVRYLEQISKANDLNIHRNQHRTPNNSTLKKKYEDMITSESHPTPVLYDPSFPIPEYENVNLTMPDDLAYPYPSPSHQQPVRNHIPAIPKYGCLKNGTLPTYRNYTQKNRGMVIAPTINVNQRDFVNIPSSSRDTRQIQNQSIMNPNPNPNLLPLSTSVSEIKKNDSQKQNEVKQLAHLMTKMNKAQQLPKRNIPNKQKRTLRRTFHIGKSKMQPKISVLVSNKTIRKSIFNKTQEMKQTPIREIKKYLIKKGFIRVGSIAPNDVLHKMYETSLLMCGEIQNHNPENLLYNYMNHNEHG